MGPRRLWPRARSSKSVVGAGPADCRRHRRPVRRAARDVCRRGSVRRRSVDDALRHDAAVACIGAGVLIGFGLSGCSFNLVLSAFSKLLPPERRGIALGAGTAAGSFGQFLFAPFGVAMIDNFRLADGADGVRRADAADHTAVARARHTAGGIDQ